MVYGVYVKCGLIYTYFTYTVELYTHICLRYSFFPSQLFILKNFESTEKLQEEYREYSYTLHLGAPFCLMFVCRLTCALAFSLSLLIMYLFIFTEPFESSCRHHYISPLIIQQVSPKKKNILLHNHSTNNMLIQCCYVICSLYLTFSQLSQ